MENKIIVFENPMFGSLRAVNISGEAWLLGTDVARQLKYTNPTKALRDHVDDEDKLTERIVLSGQHREVIVINESGFYSLVLRSKLPKARRFKHWVTSEVLPQIRKSGGFIPVKGEVDEKMILAKAVGIYQRTLEQKDRLIAEQRPKVLFADAVTSSEDSILIGEMAKLLTQNGYEIGRTRFFRCLRENGYLFKQSCEPIQKWVERGIFDTHVTIINTHHGQRERLTTKITGKGQRYFIDLFLSPT